MSGAPRLMPLGAVWDGSGVNFAVLSRHATAVDLCLFEPGRERSAERQRVGMRRGAGVLENGDAAQPNVWHAYVPGAAPGLLYGFRVHGEWAPRAGARFNAAKVVLDPYATAIGREMVWHPSLFAYAEGSAGDGDADGADSAPFAPLAAVTDGAFDWDGDRHPRTPWHRTVIYELHVKGFSALDHSLPLPARGTYLGLGSPASIRRLLGLGITAVELMPVHAHADEFRLVRRGLRNYWGYNTLAYFAPDARLAASAGSPDAVLREFKGMVKALHAAGIEVILDVVYNHTAEGDFLGPTLSLRGLDNASYYRLMPGDPSRYEDFTGCGNTLNLQSDDALRLVLDSLRYWIDEMHVDGFRFDLASALARETFAVNPRARFFDAIREDPVLSRCKLIAEPWDVGEGGYQVGCFPPGWAEWNGRYRDTVRRFWRGERGLLPEMATRLAGSSDLYGPSGRGPQASINFVTSHDGFTLADLVSYADKHNERNGEDNRDGESHNLSDNNGVEGVSGDPVIVAVRERQQRNFLLTLVLSLGVPMISGGDEVGRTQRGNNNSYCHDSPLSWTPWDVTPAARALARFVKRLIAFRHAQPLLQRVDFLTGRDGDPSGPDAPDVVWLGPDGSELTGLEWEQPDCRTLGCLLSGPRDRLLMILNADDRPCAFALPRVDDAPAWEAVLDTYAPDVTAPPAAAGAIWTVAPRSAIVFTPAPAATDSSAAASIQP